MFLALWPAQLKGPKDIQNGKKDPGLFIIPIGTVLRLR